MSRPAMHIGVGELMQSEHSPSLANISAGQLEVVVC